MLKAARSPILKPRPAFEIIEGGGKPQFEAGFGVPVRGPDAHASREPALHHKKILKNVTNPNLEEEIGKASAKTRENDGKNAVDTQNPILKYAEDINKAKAIEVNEFMMIWAEEHYLHVVATFIKLWFRNLNFKEPARIHNYTNLLKCMASAIFSTVPVKTATFLAAWHLL